MNFQNIIKELCEEKGIEYEVVSNGWLIVLKKDMPKIGMVADTPQGMGKVVSIDVFKKTYSVDLKEKGIVTFSKDEK